MSQKLNEFICPNCGHRWFESSAYGTCDACQTFFYLSIYAPRPSVFINGKPAAQFLQEQNSVQFPTHWTDLERR